MKERPILFSSNMVKAILDRRKTQTRRVIKNPQRLEGLMLKGEEAEWCPYGIIGDRLWVKETFAQCGTVMAERIAYIAYKADNPLLGATSRIKSCDVPKNKPFLKTIRKYRPSIHMPKWAARIWLEITGIRVERVQEISIADCFAEGVNTQQASHAQPFFKSLWDSLNAKRGFSWEKNPWVWVIEFKRVMKKL